MNAPIEMKDNLQLKKNVGLLILFIILLVYALLSYLISQNEVNAFIYKFIAPLLLLIPTSGVISFFYGSWSGNKWLSFSIGFVPVFMFFILSGFFETYVIWVSSKSLFLALFMGFFAGIMGYGGTIKRKGKEEWIIFVLAGMFLWIFRILAGMR